MKVFVCILGVIGYASAGIVPTGGVQTLSLNGLVQPSYSVNEIATKGYVVPQAAVTTSGVQQIQIANAGTILDRNVLNSQILAKILQALCPDNVPNLQLVPQQPAHEYRTVQLVQPVYRTNSGLNTLQLVNTAVQHQHKPEVSSIQYLHQQLPQVQEQVHQLQHVQQVQQLQQVQQVQQLQQVQQVQQPQVNYVKYVQQLQTAAPEVKYVRVVKQESLPSSDLNSYRIVQNEAAPETEIRTVKVIQQDNASAPEIKTIRVITEGADGQTPIERSVQIEKDESGAQTVRFLKSDGEEGDEKVFKIIQS